MATAQAFIVNKIQYEGLQHVPLSTVQSEIPISVGDNYTAALGDKIINDLNTTGFFNNVQLYQSGSTLIVKVHERPTIAAINFSGNQLIKSPQLKKVLTEAGLTVGSVFQQTTLNQIRNALEGQYMMRSKYAVRITTTVKNLPRNRVDVDIKISEGLAAKIERINIVGARAFSEGTLVNQLKISTPNLFAFTFLTGKDKYSQAKMDASLQALQSYYMDRGYIHYHVNSVQASIDPNHKHFYITINIHEGAKYKFGKFTLKGKLIVPQAELASLVQVTPGATFSRQDVINSVKAIQSKLANMGYAFASVNPVPAIDEKTKTVTVTFYVNPGDRMYINQINFFGNNVTNDQTLRERMKISEGATYSKKDINESTLAFQQLQYIQNIQEQTVPVPGSNNQVNVNYHVQEKTANSVSFNVGYSELDAAIVGGTFDMPNVFGTGNMFDITTQLSKPYQSVNFTFTQPFFTSSGISQSVTLFGTRVDNAERNLVNYSTNTFGGNLNYSVPLSAWNFFNFGGGYDYTRLLQPQDDTSTTVADFVKANGNKFNAFTLTVGLSRNDTNSAYFPTSGVNASVSAEASVPGSNLTWYKLLSSATWYHGLWPGYSISLYGSADYGNGYGKTEHLPFFQNFYGGGWGSVRGFEAGSLGPKDALCSGGAPCPGAASPGNSIGGNLSLTSSFNFYFPVPFMADQHNIRMGWFVDMGNIYDTYNLGSSVVGPQPTSPSLSNLRYSTGIALEWLSPLGPLAISVAEPLNVKSGDDKQIFQFSLGTLF